MGAPDLSFRPYLELLGVYDTGLSGVAVVNAQGQIANAAAEGIELTGGISGAHSWKHTRIGLEYRGSLRHYAKATYYDGTDQSLMLSLKHQFTRHIMLTMDETAGIFSLDYGLVGLPQTLGYDPNTMILPTTDFYDNQTLYLNTRADLRIQKTARLSFDLSGTGFLVRRRSTALYGVTGAIAQGDMQYRLTRKTTLGAVYTFSHFDFTRILGGSNMHMVAVSYATALSRWWEVSGYAGAARLENTFEQLVPLAPQVQALLGYASAPAVVYGRSWIPAVDVRLSRTFPTGVAYISGSRTVVPGNGLFLTSSMTTVMAGYNYTGLRRWSLGANAGYMAGNSLGNVVGRYDTLTVGLTASRQITHALHAILRFSNWRYTSPTFAQYNRPVYDLRIGLGFAPGDVPLRIW